MSLLSFPIATVTRGTVGTGVRMIGPVLAWSGLVSVWEGRGGQPTDTLTRVARFLGFHTTWIDNTREWFDAPIRHQGLVVIACVFGAVLIVALGFWAGRWLTDDQARDRLRQAYKDDRAELSRLLKSADANAAAIAMGTGTSIWMCVAALLELHALTALRLGLSAVGYVSVAALKHVWDRARSYDRPSGRESIGWTLVSLCQRALEGPVLALFWPAFWVWHILIYRAPSRLKRA